MRSARVASEHFNLEGVVVGLRQVNLIGDGDRGGASDWNKGTIELAGQVKDLGAPVDNDSHIFDRYTLDDRRWQLDGDSVGKVGHRSLTLLRHNRTIARVSIVVGTSDGNVEGTCTWNGRSRRERCTGLRQLIPGRLGGLTIGRRHATRAWRRT
jgi:hypothetical protein